MKLRSFILTSGSYGIAEIIARAVQAGVLFWVAAVCAKETFGEIALLIAVQQAITLFGIGGTVEAASGHLKEFRKSSRLPNLFASTKWVAIFGCVLGVALYAAAAFFFSGTFNYKPDLSLQVLVVMSGVWIALLQLKANIQRLQENHRTAILFRTLPIILMYVGAMLGVAWAPTPAGYFIGIICGLVGATIALHLLSASLSDSAGEPSKNSIVMMAKASFPYLIAALLAWMSGYGVNLLINAEFPITVVAEFAFVFSLNAILLLVANSINQVWAPRFLRLSETTDRECLDRANSIANRISLYMIAVVAALVLAIFPDAITAAWGNLPQYQNIHPYLFISFSTYIILTIYYRSVNYYLLEKAGNVFMRLTVWSTLLGLMLWAGLIWLLDIWGIYLGLMVTTVLRGGAIYLYAKKRWNVSMDWVDAAMAQGLLIVGYTVSVVESMPFSLMIVVFLSFIIVFFRLIKNRRYLEIAA